jgi:hypothetical protein
MKSFAAVVFVLVSCSCASSQCIEITGTELPEVKPSSRNAKITVLLSGKPQANVKLTVSLPAGEGLRFFVSDSDGNVMVNDLPEGMSCVTATTENNLIDVMCLEVLAHSKDDVRSFSMSLAPAQPPSNSFDDRVKGAEQSAPSQRLRKLAGTIADKTGAVITGAEVQVFKRGKYPDEVLTTVKTNEVGHFAPTLEPGVYTIIVRMSGFNSTFVEVEISPDGSESELHKTLQVATYDDCRSFGDD